MFKFNTVKEIIESKGLKFYDKSVLCAIAVVSDSFFKNGISNIITKGKNHVIHFGDTGLSIILVDELSGKLSKDPKYGYAFIPNSEILNNRMTFGFFKLKLHIDTKNGEIVYKISKNIFGEEWHNNNLNALLMKASAGFRK